MDPSLHKSGWFEGYASAVKPNSEVRYLVIHLPLSSAASPNTLLLSTTSKYPQNNIVYTLVFTQQG